MTKTHLKRRCQGTTRAGNACQMRPLRDSDWCWNHSPLVVADRAQARSRGGAAGKRATPSELAGTITLQGPKEAMLLLEVAANETLALDNSAARNRTLVQIALAWARVWETVLLEQRLRALESPRLVGVVAGAEAGEG